MQPLFLGGVAMKRYFKPFLLFNLLILFFYCDVISGTEIITISFQDIEHAIKNGCKISQLKTRDVKNCVLETFDGHDLILTIYDSTAQGNYIKAERIRITSWYNEAKVRYEDLLGRGVDFIMVEFEGNTGTGTLQKNLAIFGWYKGRFIPVLIEPLSYYIDSKGRRTGLKVIYEIKNRRSENIALNFNYSYSKEKPQKTLKYNWNDHLQWDNATFSFYKKEIKQEKFTDSRFPVQKKIADVRVKVAESLKTIDNIDLKILESLKIMQILD